MLFWLSLEIAKSFISFEIPCLLITFVVFDIKWFEMFEWKSELRSYQEIITSLSF